MSESDQVVFTMKVDVDTAALDTKLRSAESSIDNIRGGIMQIKDGFADMPNSVGVITDSLSKADGVIKSASDHLQSLKDNKISSTDAQRFHDSITASIGEVSAIGRILGSSGDFSIQIAKNMLSSLPSAVRQELDSVLPSVSNIVRARMSSINKNGYGINNSTATVARQLVNDKEVAKLFSRLPNLSRQANGGQVFEQYLQTMLPHIAPIGNFTEYRTQRFGSSAQTKYQALKNPFEVLPQSFRSAYEQKGYKKEIFDDAVGSTVLAAAYRQQLGQLMNSNPIAVRAALNSGIANRSNSGMLQMRQEITRNQFESFRENLYNELINRAQGRAQDELPNSHKMRSRIDDPYSTNPNTQETLARRMMSSSAGQALAAMQAIEGFERVDNWSASKGSNAYLSIPKEARRSLEQYAVREFTPWDETKKHDGRRVSITESQGTRLLGMSGKHNQDVEDIILISTAGFDKNNAEHMRRMMQYVSDSGVDIDGEKYVFQGSHGTGEDTSIRMLKKTSMDKVIADNEEWAKTNGFVGTNVFKNFVPSDYITTHKLFGKQSDAVNKLFTPGSDSGINFQGKKIGVIDWADFEDKNRSAYADGIGWMSSDLLPNSAQVRFGTGGKGTLRSVRNLKEMATRAGFLDDQGRWMVRGVGGEMFNALDMDGLMDISMFKNVGAFGGAKGTKFNDMATAMLQRFGLSYVTDFSTENPISDKVGSQMAEFMKFSQPLRAQQAEGLQNRLRALDTETGIRRYVLTDPNDPLTAAVEKNPELISSDQVRHRAELYKQSLLNRFNAGEFINFGENEIKNERLTTTPVEAFLRSQGGITQSVLNQARRYINTEGRNYTDDQLIDMLTLRNGGAVSFDDKDSEYIGVGRAPTGFGQLVYEKNYAKELEAYYDALGLDKSGIQVSREARDRMATADLDGDTVKAMRGRLLNSVLETIKAVPDIDKKLQDVKKTEVSPDYEPGDNEENRVGNILRQLEAVPKMAFGSGAGQRAAQLDLSDPKNNKFAIAALKANAIYGNATDSVKHLTESNLEGENIVWDSWRLGKEYQKLAAHTDRLFNVSEFDTSNGAQEPDLFKASNGMLINLKALRQMDMNNINLPSRYQDAMLEAIEGTAVSAKVGRAETLKLQTDAIQEALNFDEQNILGNVGDKTKALMQNMNALRLQFMSGERGMVTQDEYSDLQKMKADSIAEISAEADKHLISGTGKVLIDGKEMSRNRYIAQQAENLGLYTVDNIGTFGLLEPKLHGVVGNNLIEGFKNSITASLPNKVAESLVDHEVYVDDEQPKPRKFTAKRVKKDAAAIQEMEYDPTKTLEEQYSKLFAGFADQETSRSLLLNLTEKLHGSNNKLRSVFYDNDSQTEAQKFYGIYGAELRNARKDYNNLIENGNKDILNPNSAARQQLDKEFYDVEENYIAATRKFADTNGTKALEDLRKAISGVGDEFDKQQKAVEGFQKKVDEIKSTYQEFQKARMENPDNSEAGKKTDADTTKKLEDQIKEAEQLKAKGEDNIRVQNATNFAERYNALNYKMTGKLMTPEQKIERQVAGYQKDIDDELQKLERAREKNLIKDEDYEANKQRYNNLREYAYGRLTDDLLAKERAKEDKNFKNLISQGDKFSRNRMINQTLLGRNILINQQELTQRRQYAEILTDKLNQKQGILDGYKAKGLGPGNVQYDKIAGQVNDLTDAIDKNKAAMSGLTGVAGGANAIMATFGTTVNRVITQFGRRLFAQAIQQVRSFVKQYDAAMTQIQIVTLKSDDEISDIGKSLINKAIDLKVSVADVTSTATALYRQGLTDEQMDQRLDDAVKLQKVADISAKDSVKIITTAMNSGMVDSSTEAMDAIVALGDSAATTAADIQKGMQRSLSAAKDAKVTYNQLAAMLTIITSKTQLGGNVAGTTLASVFGKLQKASNKQLVYDANGNIISNSPVAQALASVGVKMYNNESGQFLGAANILSQLASVWNNENISDAQRSNIAYQLASGGRQSSNFLALMSGMSDEQGLFDRYLETANKSEGITDKKNQEYMKSLAAAMDQLRSSYDGLIASFNMSQPLIGISNVFSQMIQNLTAANEATNGWASTIIMLTAAIGALSAAMFANPVLGAALLITGATVATIGAIGASKKRQEQSKPYNVYNRTIDEVNKRDVQISDKYSKLQKYVEQNTNNWDKAKQSFINQFTDLAGQLSNAGIDVFTDGLLDATTTVSDLASSADTAASALNSIKSGVQNYKKSMVQQVITAGRQSVGAIIQEFEDDYASKKAIADDAAALSSLGSGLNIKGYNGENISQADYEFAVEQIKQGMSWDSYTNNANIGYVTQYEQNLVEKPYTFRQYESMDVSDSAVQLLSIPGIRTVIQEYMKGNQRASSIIDNFINSSMNSVLARGAVQWVIDNGAYNNPLQSIQDIENGDTAWYDMLSKQQTKYEIVSQPIPVYAPYNMISDDMYSQLVAEYQDANQLPSTLLEYQYSRNVSNSNEKLFNEMRKAGMLPLSLSGMSYSDVIKDVDKYNAFVRSAGEYKQAESSFNEDEFANIFSGYAQVVDIDNKFKGHYAQIGKAISSYYSSNMQSMLEEGYDHDSVMKWYEDELFKLYDSNGELSLQKIISLAQANGYSKQITQQTIENQDAIIQRNRVARASIAAYENQRAQNYDDLLNMLFRQALNVNKSEGGWWKLSDLSSIINDEKYKKDLDKMLESNTPLANALTSLFTYDNNTGQYKLNYDNDEQAEALYSDFMFALAQAVPGYSNYVSRQDQASMTMANYNKLVDPYNFTYLDDLENLGFNETTSAYQKDLLKTILGQQLFNSILVNRTASSDTQEYGRQLISAYGLGASGISEYNTLLGSKKLFDSIGNGTYDEVRGNMSNVQYDLYSGAIDGLSQYIRLSELSEQQRLSEGVSAEKYLLIQKQIDDEIKNKSFVLLSQYGKRTDQVASAMSEWSGDAQDVANANKKLNQTLTTITNNQYFRTQARKGNWSSDVVKGISGMTGYDDEYIKNNKDQILKQLTTFENADIATLQNSVSSLDEWLTSSINDYYAGKDLSIEGPSFVVDGVGQVDFSQAKAQLNGIVDDEFLDIISQLSARGITGHIVTTSDGKGGFDAKVVVGSLGSGYKGSGGGGGGGGKSDSKKLIESLKRQMEEVDHRIKMVRYQQTRYKNDGQLGNYGNMLQLQTQLHRDSIPVLQEHLQKLKTQMATVKKGSDDWFELRDAILQTQQKIEQTTNTIAENTRQLAANEQAILKLKSNLQQAVLSAIETAQQEQRDQLAGMVNLQNSIMDVIKRRYQEQWDLISKDIDKKKQALQEQNALIDERLQKRKDAANEAQKYEQLASLRNQLASIELDPTRTKDAIEMRKKISDLQKQLAWDVADSQANAQKQANEDQINALDEYQADYQERLDSFLSDSRNFVGQINELLKLSQEELMDWFMTNDIEYIKSLEDMQKQMLQSWEDTFKQAHGIVDTYWQQINGIVSNKDMFLEYMKNTSQYINASQEQQKQLQYQWNQMWENWYKAQDASAQYVHTDDFLGEGGLVDKTLPGATITAPTATIKSEKTQLVTDGLILSPQQQNALMINSKNHEKGIDLLINSGLIGGQQAFYLNPSGTNDSTGQKTITITVSDKLRNELSAYADGGYVNFTGPAWVDGTPSKPEAFLNAEDTAILRGMLDAFKAIKVPSFLSNISGSAFTSNSQSVGDVNINLYEAKLQNDADYENVARKVGQAFTKELVKQGFRTANYTF